MKDDMKEKQKEKIQKINIQIDGDTGDGEYANFVVITHSPAEFVMDFTRLMPGAPKAKVHSRIIMAPQHAKAFMKALADNISRFEQKYGTINLPGKEPFSEYDFNPPDESLPN